MERLNVEGTRILVRLLSSLPAATFEMETFARLAGVIATTSVPTAAMECRHRPRLLMNPNFVAEYCQRDEHLFLLVMHELWHVMLAHTSLYPKVTKAQNVVFDAIINANLMRQFNQPQYMGFFDRLYQADRFPELLLRPPVGWPENPQYQDGGGPSGTLRIMRQLYPKLNERFILPYYDEILDLLKQYARDNNLIDTMPVLLGNHDDSADDTYRNHFLKEAIGQVTKRWPYAPGRGGASFGGHLNEWEIHQSDASYAMRQAFSGLLRQYLTYRGGAYEQKQKQPLIEAGSRSVLPNGRDRLMPARRMLGVESLLWMQNQPVKARISARQSKAFIYLDVSGSMSDVLPYLMNLITPYVLKGLAEVYQFSTQVDMLPAKDLAKSIVKTTGGTNIMCVMNHLEKCVTRVNRVLILTDGYTGRPLPKHIQLVQENRLPICVVLPSESPYEDDLSEIASRYVVLPHVG